MQLRNIEALPSGSLSCFKKKYEYRIISPLKLYFTRYHLARLKTQNNNKNKLLGC